MLSSFNNFKINENLSNKRLASDLEMSSIMKDFKGFRDTVLPVLNIPRGADLVFGRLKIYYMQYLIIKISECVGESKYINNAKNLAPIILKRHIAVVYKGETIKLPKACRIVLEGVSNEINTNEEFRKILGEDLISEIDKIRV